MQEMWELGNGVERRYIAPPPNGYPEHPRINASEDLHAWSIYRQNLNSDFTDSALGFSERSPRPYGNFQLRESTVKSILNNPRYGPKSELGSNMSTYLKFGLPRVLPPPRLGSSGYDSSDDGSPFMGNSKRSKSDPDFRNNAMSCHPEGRTSKQSKRLRSSSEANLLSKDAYYRERASVSSNSKPAWAMIDNQGTAARAQGPFGVISQDSDNDIAMLNEKYFPRDSAWVGIEEGHSLKHPHLQVRAIAVQNRGKNKRPIRLLEGVSFEVRGGEVLAVMATTEPEGSCILDLLAGKKRVWKQKFHGDIMLNGNHIGRTQLKRRVVLANQDTHFTSEMSVRQTLLFQTLLTHPARKQRHQDRQGKINALINDLGLSQVKHTRVRELTISEKRRLNIACHLLSDTDIVLLDQPTKGMDIFDTFFLVEYVRQWAMRGRIVILTIHPPTYEIFSMITKVLLLSTGRVMYFGRRREMLPYFTFIEYPCPAFKNPSDYYVDLVTLDDLSSEARLESSQRVDQLAETFARRQETLSDPGPPSALPPKLQRSNPLMQCLALWIRALFYLFPYNVVEWLIQLSQAALMSCCVGAIYWHMRTDTQEQEHINDRLGFHYAMTSLAPWPIIFNTVSEAWQEKAPVTRDVNDGLYGRFAYIITKIITSTPPALCVYLTYAAIAYYMSGLDDKNGLENFNYYLLYMILYLLGLRYMCLFSTYIFSSKHVAMCVVSVLMLFISLSSGYAVHTGNLSVSNITKASPAKWVIEAMAIREFHGVSSFQCSRSPTIPQKNGNNTILVVASCGIEDGAQAMNFYAINQTSDVWFLPMIALSVFAAGFILFSIIIFLIVKQTPKESRSQTFKM